MVEWECFTWKLGERAVDNVEALAVARVNLPGLVMIHACASDIC